MPSTPVFLIAARRREIHAFERRARSRGPVPAAAALPGTREVSGPLRTAVVRRGSVLHCGSAGPAACRAPGVACRNGRFGDRCPLGARP